MSGRIFHAPFLAHHPAFRIKRIVERSAGNDVAKLYPAVIRSQSFDELLDDDEIELVIVNTPDDTHFELCEEEP